ncbi:hypothetical protein BDZ89DRAFT_1131160 [Hymenopellis radicata]|nr:hypothetical protein BDZ89DRAFT_1131160 [Hymenopellis radicata]
MANIYACGLARLDVYVGDAFVTVLINIAQMPDFKPTVSLTAHRTLFHFFAVSIVTFTLFTSSLATRNVGCQRPSRVDLEQAIRALDHTGFLAHNEVNAGPPTLPDLSLVTSGLDTVRSCDNNREFHKLIRRHPARLVDEWQRRYLKQAGARFHRDAQMNNPIGGVPHSHQYVCGIDSEVVLVAILQNTSKCCPSSPPSTTHIIR